MSASWEGGTTGRVKESKGKKEGRKEDISSYAQLKIDAIGPFAPMILDFPLRREHYPRPLLQTELGGNSQEKNCLENCLEIPYTTKRGKMSS